MYNPQLHRVEGLLNRVTMSLFGKLFTVKVSLDDEFTYFDPSTGENVGRVYLQIVYTAPCTNENIVQEWKGRKWYLSKFMTNDEIIKTCYVAFKSAVEHEIMEGFKVDNTILFNPHTNFEALLSVSSKEITRS